MSRVRKNDIANTSTQNKLLLYGGLNRRHRVPSLDEKGTQRRVAAPLHQKDPVEMDQASYQNVSWTLPIRGFLSMSKWEETLGQTQNRLERLYIQCDLGMPWDYPGGSGEHGLGKGRLNYLVEPAAPATQF